MGVFRKENATAQPFREPQQQENCSKTPGQNAWSAKSTANHGQLATAEQRASIPRLPDLLRVDRGGVAGEKNRP